MVTEVRSPQEQPIVYPDSDGEPMADNTLHFDLIVLIKENLERLYITDPNAFIAADLLWYPVEGDNQLRQAPDVMVALGRPKGYRGSYKQWEEDNIPPQVVFEIWSQKTRPSKMAKKQAFYQRYGVEEYYLYDPDLPDLTGWRRNDDRLEPIEQMDGWVSPRLGIRFQISEEGLQIYRPDGERFLTTLELEERAQTAEERAQTAEAELERERQRSQLMADRLRELGINPE